jgi:DNA-binding NtrC family response regulator
MSENPLHHYRLRGCVQGVERTYYLTPGRNRVGSLDGNDVVLPVRGVSRRHASLSVGNDGLIVEDLASKNGTVLNGQFIRRASLGTGDELRFGPVRLKLEAIEPGDRELAISLDRPHVTPTGLSAEETTSVATAERRTTAALWLAVVEGVLARLTVMPEQDLSGAVRFLAKGLLAQGACVVEWSRGAAAVVLASAGTIESHLEQPALEQFLANAARPGAAGGIRTALLDDEPVLAGAIVSEPGADRLGLFVWGDYPSRAESEPLLRVLVGLLDRFRPRPMHVTKGAPEPATTPLSFPEGYVPGDSPVMASLYAQMLPLTQGDLPVMIIGETGVGKEFLARILHTSSSRRSRPFVAVNCAAIPSELLEAEMFGIGKGVATGVVERQGKFQLAEGGTLFLDEIGDMPLELQAKLLRALQEKEIHPVGSRPVTVDIRVIAATNTDLHRRMDEGRFRRDLYYRVAGYVLAVPALRQRKEDIPVLVEQFVREDAQEIGKTVRGVTVRALRAMVDYDWPGNVRELEHEVRRLVYLCPDGGALDSLMLSAQILALGTEATAAPAARDAPAGAASGECILLEEGVALVEARLIREALARAGGNRTQAAKLLGISRNGLAIKIDRLGLAG